jgi:virginiamycin B lyase
MDDGSAWIAERKANAILHVTANGRQTVIRLSDREFYPVGAKAAGGGGALFDGPEAGKIVAVDRLGHVRTYVLPTRSSHTSSARQGLDGIVWVAEYDANKIVAIDPKGRMSEYAVPTPNGGPGAIAVDRRGALWFIETDGEKLGRIDRDGTVEDAYLPIDLGRPAYLEAAPDDMLVVIGYTKGLLGASVSWAIARIPEATAMR